MKQTCVFFHAHPDDEALLTAGTIARLAVEGHRVVVVFATGGEQGLVRGTASGPQLGQLRRAEARAAAAVLGCTKVEFLGYADSGQNCTAAQAFPKPSFSTADPHEAARDLAAVLIREQAVLLTTYDPVGGYGHPDHVQVNRVGYLAAALAETPVVLEATMDRDRIMRIERLVRLLLRGPLRYLPGFAMPRVAGGQFDHAYTPRSGLTHRVDVRPWCAAKRAALAAHGSQTAGGQDVRTVAALLRLPEPVFRWVLGTEYYVQRGLPFRAAYTHPLDGLGHVENGPKRSWQV